LAVTTWTQEQQEQLTSRWADPAYSARDIAAELGVTRNAVIGKAHALQLPPPPPRAKRRKREPGEMLVGVRKAYASKGDDTTLTRFVKEGRAERPVQPHGPRQLRLPTLGNASVEAGRSIFHRKGVKPVAAVRNVLVSGHSNVKIGRDVRKGRLRGYWIYTLSLEERATCPRSCALWTNCYGNHMPYAKRVQHGPELEAALEREIPALLGKRGRVGILIRLHALGDFYSVGYVRFWRRMLEQHPRLACYGYTARMPHTPIGAELEQLREDYPERFAIRYSNGGYEDLSTVTIRSEVDVSVNATVCPEQTGKTLACATCGLCWHSPRNIAFIEH
jgi:hypothetical protein